ncbi:MAG: hypothetical protein K5765_05070 [Clostridia bacterium]|nr:hypothetical protein [Clostridia bacterium]
MTQKYLEDAKELFEVMSKLKTADEFSAFLGDLCTIKEIQDMAQRFEVAKLLEDKKIYNEITAKTGASAATISRVNRCLQYGEGYKLALSKLKGKK